jgi:Zn-dependent protease with chaperone function
VRELFLQQFWTIAFSGHMLEGPLNAYGSSFASRQSEKEADEVAAEILKDQQISATGSLEFFKSMEEYSKEYNHALTSHFSTHPDYPSRIKLFRREYPSYPVLSIKNWVKLKSVCKS